MSDHDGFEGLAAGYALHSLEPEDEQRLAAHLLSCHSCARLVADTAAVGAAFADLIPVEAAPPGLRARILEAAAAEPRSPVARAGHAVRPRVAVTPDRSPGVLSRPSAAPGGPIHRDRVRRLQMRSRVAVGVLAAVVGVGVAVPVTLAVSDRGNSGTSNTTLTT